MNIAFIPARGGSKSIKNKNIIDICGRPLIWWTIKELEISNCVDKIVIATDSEMIWNTVKSFNFTKTVLYSRSNSSATDGAQTEEVLLEYLADETLDDRDLVILVQATNPFSKSSDFENAVKVVTESEYDSLLSGSISKRFFWDEGKPINYDYLNRPRRQDYKGLFMENGAFYIGSVSGILNASNRLHGKIYQYEMPEYSGFEIDEIDDIQIVENLLLKYSLNTCPNIRLFISDVDGTLTDSGMYYDSNGIEIKKFNTHDGMGFQLLRNSNIKTAIITSEKNLIIEKRAEKLKVDYLYMDLKNKGKLDAAKEICIKEGITLGEVAYIGDDINCYELLKSVGFAGCPNDAVDKIKNIRHISIMKNNGGHGAVREFIDEILVETK